MSYRNAMIRAVIDRARVEDLANSGFITEWTVSAGQQITLPLRNENSSVFNFSVNWGDGTIQHCTTHIGISHTYANAGVYRVTIEGRCEGWSFSNAGSRLAITDIIDWGRGNRFEGFRFLAGGFHGCANLRSMGGANSTIKASGGGCGSFNDLFRECVGVRGTIPANLFVSHPNVFDFNRTFLACLGISGFIPAGLFSGNPLARTFFWTFMDCSGLTGSIPEGLFANNPLVTIFQSTFLRCSGLTGSIPAALFANNPLVTDFQGALQGCFRLTGTIPAALFANNPLVTSFQSTLSGCSGLTGTIPAALFANNPLVTNFVNTLLDCSGLTGSIPEGLFANNPLVTDFWGALQGCFRLTGTIPAALFANNPLVTIFANTLSGCSGLTGSIPEGLFANQLNLVNLSHTFHESFRLQPSANIFAADSAALVDRFINRSVNFTNCFARNIHADNGVGTVPELWLCNFGTGTPIRTGCFAGTGNNINTITNFNNIPTLWR